MITDGQTDGRTDGRTDGQTDGRTDGRTDWLIAIYPRIKMPGGIKMGRIWFVRTVL